MDHEKLAQLFNKCLKGQIIPDHGNVGYISSIFKKGDKRMCSKLQGNKYYQLSGEVAEPNTNRKNRIRIGNGFRTGGSRTHNITATSKAKNLSIHLLFVDLEKAYDTIGKTLSNIDESWP